MSKGYQALRQGAAWIDLSARGRIQARGRDRVRLLHNICSNDVKKMTPGTGSCERVSARRALRARSAGQGR